MIFRALADLVVLVHFGFVGFVLLGGLLALRWRRAVCLHLPAALWGAFVAASGRVCPLTPFENWLRGRAGLAPYETGFVERYLLPVLYPSALTREVQWFLAAGVVFVNLAVYWWVFRRRCGGAAG